MILARGRVDRRGDVVHVRADYLERLDIPHGAGPPGAPRELPLRPRDFH